MQLKQYVLIVAGPAGAGGAIIYLFYRSGQQLAKNIDQKDTQGILFREGNNLHTNLYPPPLNKFHLISNKQSKEVELTQQYLNLSLHHPTDQQNGSLIVSSANYT